MELVAVFPEQKACLENIVGDREIPDHPLVQQTVDDCLHEAMDIEGLEAVLRGMESGAIEVLTRELTEPSCLAHEVLSAKLPGRNFDYFLTQRGMFSYTGLTAAQVDRLKEEFAVYLVRSGRMCVAGLNSKNVEATASAMAAVLA